jgi:hypothetical protein
MASIAMSQAKSNLDNSNDLLIAQNSSGVQFVDLPGKEGYSNWSAGRVKSTSGGPISYKIKCRGKKNICWGQGVDDIGPYIDVFCDWGPPCGRRYINGYVIYNNPDGSKDIDITLDSGN